MTHAASDLATDDQGLSYYLQLMQSRLRVGLWLGVVLIPLFALADYLHAPQHIGYSLGLRLLASGCLLGLLWINSRGRSLTRQDGLIWLAALLVASLLEVRLIHLSGQASLHYTGLYLVLGASLVLVPTRLGVAVGIALSVLTVYLLPLLLLQTPIPPWQIWQGFYGLAGVACLLVLANLLHRQALLEQFRLRVQVERGRRQLQELAASLEEKVQQRTRELELSEGRYRSLVESNPALIYTLGLDGSYTFLGPRCQDLLGYAPHEVLGSFFVELVLEEDRHQCVRHFKQVRDHGLLLAEVEYRLRRPDGQVRNFLSYTAPYYDEQGQVIGMIGTAVDVTEERRLSQEKERYREELEQALERLAQANLDIVKALAGAIEAKDPYTRGHAERVSLLSLAMSQQAGLPESERLLLEYAAVLHDVGKIGTRREVLNKNGPLDAEEYAHIKLHSQVGDAMLEGVGLLAPVRPLIRAHHERFDGRGYPDGLAGQDIPLLSRIMAVADAFDAMRSRRPYRDPLSAEMAWRRLQEGAGSHFDPQVVDLLVQVAKVRAHEEDWLRSVGII